MNDKAILDGKTVVIENDLLKWAEWFQKTERQVSLTWVIDIRISTVFLGLDHGYGDKQCWFETMIFGGKHSGYQKRYTTWEEAEAGHAVAVKLVKGIE